MKSVEKKGYKNLSGCRPVGYAILVKPDPIDKQTKGGILLPETARDDYGRAQTLGTLVAVGEAAWDKYPSPWAEVGDRVMFAKYGGLYVIGIDGECYRVLNDESIKLVVDTKLKLSDLEVHEVRTTYE